MTVQHDIFAWLDTIPLPRPVTTLEMDFTDGLVIAEIIAYFFPEYVDFNKFHTARNMTQRIKNWRVLNSDVLPKLGLHAPGTVVHDITNGDKRASELFLHHLIEKLEETLIRTGRKSRLQWETWKSFNNERLRLPNLIKPRTPKRTLLVPSYASFTTRTNGRIVDPYALAFDDVIKVKDEEIELLLSKLKRCEKLIRIKDKQIQDLQEQLGKFKPNRTSH